MPKTQDEIELKRVGKRSKNPKKLKSDRLQGKSNANKRNALLRVATRSKRSIGTESKQIPMKEKNG